MKEQILKLRNEGKTYSEIRKELNCSLSTISYHCGDNQKQMAYNRVLKKRKDKKMKRYYYFHLSQRFITAKI